MAQQSFLSLVMNLSCKFRPVCVSFLGKGPGSHSPYFCLFFNTSKIGAGRNMGLPAHPSRRIYGGASTVARPKRSAITTVIGPNTQGTSARRGSSRKLARRTGPAMARSHSTIPTLVSRCSTLPVIEAGGPLSRRVTPTGGRASVTTRSSGPMYGA